MPGATAVSRRYRIQPRESTAMSAHGLNVFEKSIRVASGGLDENSDATGPNRQLFRHVQMPVLRTLHTQLSLEATIPLLGQFLLIVASARRPANSREIDVVLSAVTEKCTKVLPEFQDCC
jgi:hypothetical protein